MASIAFLRLLVRAQRLGNIDRLWVKPGEIGGKVLYFDVVELLRLRRHRVVVASSILVGAKRVERVGRVLAGQARRDGRRADSRFPVALGAGRKGLLCRRRPAVVWGLRRRQLLALQRIIEGDMLQ